MGYKMKGFSYPGKSPAKQKAKKVGQDNEIPWEDVDKHHQEALKKKMEGMKGILNKQYVKKRWQGEDRPEPTFDGTDYYGPPDISRDEADKKLNKANYDYDKAFPNWNWRKGKGMKDAVKGAITGGAARGKKKSSPAKNENTPYSEGAQNLLKAIPNQEAYDKLSEFEKKEFDKVAKKHGLPQKKVRKT